MNPKTTPSSLLIKAVKLTLLVLVVLQFDRCAKPEDSTATGTSFCCDPYGLYIGVEVNSSSSGDPQSGYQSSSDSFDYEYSISPTGTDSIRILEYNLSTQSSYTHDLPLMSATEDEIIFGWDRSFPPYHINSYIFSFKQSNDTLSLESTRENYQSSSQGSGFSRSSSLFKGTKQ